MEESRGCSETRTCFGMVLCIPCFFNYSRKKNLASLSSQLNWKMMVDDTVEYDGSIYIPAGKALCVKIQNDAEVKKVLKMLEGRDPLPGGVTTLEL